MLENEKVFKPRRLHTKQTVPRPSRMLFRLIISTQDHVLAPRDTRTRPQNVPTFHVAARGTIAHARAQTTPADRTATHRGIVMRVQLEELVAVAARILATAQSLAARGPVQRTSERA